MGFWKNNIILIALCCWHFNIITGQEFCPDATQILPCTCIENGTLSVDIDCSLAMTENEIEQAFLAEFPQNNLTKFTIMYNRNITEFTKNVFVGVNFQHIIIQRSVLTSIETSFFDSSFRTVTKIDFSINELTNFPFSELTQFTVLADLYLSNNAFSSLPQLTSTTLEYLSFYSNSIVTVSDFGFRNCPALVDLYLYDNLITDLPSSSFVGASALETVELSYNKIAAVRTATFSGLPSLKSVIFYDNPITVVEDAAFLNLPKLTNLNFDFSLLQSFGRDILYEVHNITSFHLDNTNIESIEPYTFVDFEADYIVLYLHFNNITSLIADTFTGLSQAAIFLYSNSITTIEAGAFRDITNSTIYLYNNLMTNLDESWLGPILEAENDIDMGNNPLDCGCDMYWLFLSPKRLDQLVGSPSCNNGTLISDLVSNFYLNTC